MWSIAYNKKFIMLNILRICFISKYSYFLCKIEINLRWSRSLFCEFHYCYQFSLPTVTPALFAPIDLNKPYQANQQALKV